jgi:hypothetical protein
MDALDRLYRKLLDVRGRTSPGGDGQAITIAEVYQQLVPYRLVRGELGFSELKEYEHALLRLFAGERGYVRVRVAKVADEFRRELRSPNPILGIYRDYAAAEVDLADPAAAALPRPAPDAADRDTHHDPAASGAAGTPPEDLPAIGSVSAPAAGALAPTGTADQGTSASECWRCNEPLPAGVAVRFCPHCGASQVVVPCPECVAPLQPAWKFCVQCGASRPETSAPRSAG